MSWSIQITARFAGSDFTTSAPWVFESNASGTVAILRLHTDVGRIFLDGEEDPFSPIFYSDYIPASASLSKSAAVDANSGGDLDQVRGITLAIADQLANDQTMTSLVEERGILWAGAKVEIFDGLPVEGEPLPDPWWVGKILEPKAGMTTLHLVCEHAGDTKPAGLIVSGESIRPIVVGSVRSVELPLLEDTETPLQLTKIGYTSAGFNPSVDPQDPYVYDQEHYTAEFLYEDLATRTIFLCPNRTDTAFFEEHFPDGICEDSNWYLEVIYGDGKGMRRRLKVGGHCRLYNGTNGPPFANFPPSNLGGITLPQQTRQLVISLEEPFVREDLYIPGIIGESALFAYRDVLGYGGIVPEGRVRSYLSLFRKDFRFATPLRKSRMDLLLKDAGSFVPYKTGDRVVDEGASILVAPLYGKDSGTSVFVEIPMTLGENVRQALYPPASLSGTIQSTFEESGGSYVLAGGQRFWLGLLTSGIRNLLTGGLRVWFCMWVSADRASIHLGLSAKGYQGAAENPEGQIKILPLAMKQVELEVFRPTPTEPAVAKLLMPWMAGYDAETDTSYRRQNVSIPIDGWENDASFLRFGFLLTGSPGTFETEIKRLAIFVERKASITALYADVVGPRYNQAPGGIVREIVPGFPMNSLVLERSESFDNVPFTSGILETQAIEDHVHAIEYILREHGEHGSTIDVASFEAAYFDMMAKTRAGLVLPPVDERPKCSFVLTQVKQMGDVLAQIARDGGLIGGRNAAGKRTLKAFLARTWLPEQDYTISDYYPDRAGDIVLDQVKPGLTPIDDVVTAPLIRYAVEDGAPVLAVQVTNPDAPTYSPEYCTGFLSPSQAELAWNICHKGWLRTGQVHARELSMITVYEHSSLMHLLMPDRGCGQLEWMVQQKPTIQVPVLASLPVAKAPNGSRILVKQWRHAPGEGKRGTLVASQVDPTIGVATLTIILDPPQ